VVLASSAAVALGNAAGGSSQAGAPKTNTGDNMNNRIATKPSPKDASTKARGLRVPSTRSDAASPGGTMKK
jgi:hypothetical protein